MTKEERIKERQDSVDEVDTTDLENWCLKARRPKRKGQVERLPREFATPEKHSLEEALLN